MLVLKRQLNEGLVIGNDIFITVTVVGNSEERCVELSIELPDNMTMVLPDIEIGPKGV
jgi:sRNA-binding carbon storage regulator CsrA